MTEQIGIGIIGLSAPLESKYSDLACDALKAEGFSLTIPIPPSQSYGQTTHFFACASPEARVHALVELLRDPKVQALLAVRGGYGSTDLLPLFDFQLFRKYPKPIIGFSDVTAFLLALYTRCPELRCAVHGPALSTLAHLRDPQMLLNQQRLYSFLRDRSLDYSAAPVLRHYQGPTKATGPLVGGNLHVLVSLLGTPWFPNLSGHLLFLEETSEKPYRVHRALLQLKLAGVLDQVVGVLLGSFEGCIHPQGLGPTLDDVFADIFQAMKIPVWSGLACGHQGLNFPLPYGIRARIINNTLELIETFV